MPSRKIALYFAVVALLAYPIFCPPAQAQRSASWFGGSGNWSNANHWQCTVPDGTCIPSGDFLVNANSGKIALDINANVSNFDGTGSTALSLDGTSLTVHTAASDPGGTFSGRLEVDGGLTLSNGARVDTGDGNTVLAGFSTFHDSTLLTKSLFLNTSPVGLNDLTVHNSLLDTFETVIDNHVSVVSLIALGTRL